MSSLDDKPHIPKIDETKPVVWTPEDASRFLTSAIHEAQKPLAEALKQRPITSKALTLIVAVLVVAALAIALILSSQLEKTEKRADAVQAAREEILSEKVNLEAQTTSLQERLTVITNQHLDLKGQIDTLRQNEEKHKRTQTDLGRFRRQNELLRSQITGLEMEKVALSRQLEAVKALAAEDPEEGDVGIEGDVGPFDASGAAVVDGSSPAPEQADGGDAVAVEEPKESAEPAPADPAPAEPVVEPVAEPVTEPVAVPEPVVVPEPVAEPEPAVIPEPAQEPEPVVTPEPVAAPVPEPVAVPEPAVAPKESEPAAPAESAIVSDPVAPEPVVAEPAVPEGSAETTEPAAPAEPVEDAIDVDSLRARAAEAMEKAAALESSQPVVTPASRDQFKLDPEKAAEMDKALQEGRAVPGTLTVEEPAEAEAPADTTVAADATDAVTAPDAEDAAAGQTFPEAEADVAAEPETAAPSPENTDENPENAAPASASEYVTLNPDAAVPTVQADAGEGE